MLAQWTARLPEFFVAGHCRGYARVAAIQPKGALGTAVVPHLRVGHVVTRSPLLTRDPTPFEKAYFNYQNRLRKALSNPFPFEFYFKPGSLLSGRFKVEEQMRENWLLHRRGSDEDRRREREQDLNDAELMQERMTAQPRVTDADFHRNPRSLNRLGSRTLYLLLKEEGSSDYSFPESNVPQGLLLHQVSRPCSCRYLLIFPQAAKKGIHDECGPNVDTWVVGKVPVGFYERDGGGQPAFKVCYSLRF